MKSTTGTQDTPFPLPDEKYNAQASTDPINADDIKSLEDTMAVQHEEDTKPSRTDLDAQLDEILEKLYNSAWVEGNNYDDTLEQIGIDTEVRSEKELSRCKRAKQALTKLIEQEVQKALDAKDV